MRMQPGTISVTKLNRCRKHGETKSRVEYLEQSECFSVSVSEIDSYSMTHESGLYRVTSDCGCKTKYYDSCDKAVDNHNGREQKKIDYRNNKREKYRISKLLEKNRAKI